MDTLVRMQRDAFLAWIEERLVITDDSTAVFHTATFRDRPWCPGCVLRYPRGRPFAAMHDRHCYERWKLIPPSEKWVAAAARRWIANCMHMKTSSIACVERGADGRWHFHALAKVRHAWMRPRLHRASTLNQLDYGFNHSVKVSGDGPRLRYALKHVSRMDPWPAFFASHHPPYGIYEI